MEEVILGRPGSVDYSDLKRGVILEGLWGWSERHPDGIPEDFELFWEYAQRGTAGRLRAHHPCFPATAEGEEYPTVSLSWAIQLLEMWRARQS